MLRRALVRPRSIPRLVLLLLACAACSGVAGPGAGPGREHAGEPAPAGGLEITYVGNEGFLIASGETKVLVDALYRQGVAGYLVHPPALREKLESAAPPFDGVDIVLATHFHADHFDAGAVAAHLEASPGALFVSTPQAVEKMRAGSGWPGIRDRVRETFPPVGDRFMVTHGGATVTAVNLHHGRGRPIQNLGFIIEVGGRRLLHMGDTQASREDLAPHRLEDSGIDICLIPYWYLTDGSLREAAMREVRPRTVVPIHIPAADAPASYFGEPGALEGLLAAIDEAHPGAVIFREPLERRTF